MRQQQWSSRALEQILAVKGKSPAEQSKYKTLCMKMPGYIQRSGLVQAVVFVQSRGASNMGPAFCDALAAVYDDSSGNQLRGTAQRAGLAQYLAMNRDLIEVAAWMRRLAQIELADITETDLED